MCSLVLNVYDIEGQVSFMTRWCFLSALTFKPVENHVRDKIHFHLVSDKFHYSVCVHLYVSDREPK